MWTTHDEITFLTLLGTGTHADAMQCHMLHGCSRLLLLQRYQHAMSLRHEWAGMKPKRIQDALTQMIRQEQRESSLIEKAIVAHA